MHPTLGAATSLVRLAHRRGEHAFLDALRRGSAARTMVLVGGKPVIRSTPDRTAAELAWLAMDELAGLDTNAATVAFLGVEPTSGAGRFALALPEHAAVGWQAVLSPAVDLRSLATQGVLSPDELSLAGQAKALHHWHEDNRCCGRCGARTRPADPPATASPEPPPRRVAERPPRGSQRASSGDYRIVAIARSVYNLCRDGSSTARRKRARDG